MRIFLGGTCASSDWRAELISKLNKDIEYFNPVVKDWTPECMKIEEQEKIKCDVHLYVITPQMKGVYSIAELINDVHDINIKTYFCVLQNIDVDGEALSFGTHEMKSLGAVAKMVLQHGGHVIKSLNMIDVAKIFNSAYNLENHKN